MLKWLKFFITIKQLKTFQIISVYISGRNKFMDWWLLLVKIGVIIQNLLEERDNDFVVIHLDLFFFVINEKPKENNFKKVL